MNNNLKLDKNTLLDMYRIMVRIRLFEEEAIELAKAGLSRAVVHTYVGQEAVAAGACAHLSTQDYITSTHRGHGHCIAKGADLRKMFAELLGRETGYCKGKGGSMHIADLDTGNLGANGIVGGGIPLATGAALGLNIRKSSNVVVSFFGDGAANQGAFHEAINLASVWNLPVVYVCENNKYGISTHYKTVVNIEHISDRAKAYGIPGVTVDGNDVVEVYKAIGEAVTRCRDGKGPTLIEADTYRLSGHYFGDSENYRSREEVAAWKEKDPLIRCTELLVNDYGVTSEELNRINQEEAAKVSEASETAKNDSEPQLVDMTEDLYDPTFADIKWVAFERPA
jgi:TPP-dependent pyruvate/acetoin dehydrogenase alpha subunit